MADKGIYITEPVPAINASAVPAGKYRRLAALILDTARAIADDDPDFMLWKNDLEAWEKKHNLKREGNL